MIGVLRGMLPPPDFAALEGDTVVVGVDTDEQRASLPAEGVRYVVLGDRRPVWVSEVDDLVVIDAGSVNETNGPASILEAVRGLVTA